MEDRIENQKMHWDTLADKYEEFYSLDRVTPKLKRKVNFLIDASWMSFALLKDLGICCFALEVGCGTGVFTRELAKTEANIAAIDLSSKMIEKAWESCYRHNVGFYVCDAHQISYPDKTFDAIVGAYVLHYLDLDIALKGFYRVLKDDGRIAFLEPNKLNPILFALTHIGFIKRLFKRSKYADSYTKNELKRILERNGFKNVKIYAGEFVSNRRLNAFIESIPVIREFGGTLFVKGVKENAKI